MKYLFDLMFNPPPIPEIHLPVASRMLPGVKVAIAEAFKLAYHRGLYDGAIAGVLVTLLFVPSLRKGVSDVAKHF